MGILANEQYCAQDLTASLAVDTMSVTWYTMVLIAAATAVSVNSS